MTQPLTPQERRERINAAFVNARTRWSRLEAALTRNVRSSYDRATRALADRIADMPVTPTQPPYLSMRRWREQIERDLRDVQSLLTVEVVANLQRGILGASAASAVEAYEAIGVDEVRLRYLTRAQGIDYTVGAARLRQRLSATGEDIALAFIGRSRDGMFLSDAVWRTTGPWHGAILEEVEQALITGQSFRSLAQQVRGYIQEPRKATWQTERLARTEINMAARETTVLMNRANPFYRGVRWLPSEYTAGGVTRGFGRTARGSYPVCLICIGLSTSGHGDWKADDDNGFYARGNEPTPMASHPNCVLGDTLVWGPSVVAGTRRWYEGYVVRVRTAQGRALSITPNHPILTPRGWVAAGALHEGDEVVCDAGTEWGSYPPRHPHQVQPPPTICEVTEALAKARGMATVHMPGSPEQFHGDGGNAEVYVVRADRLLERRLDAARREERAESPLVGTDVKFTGLAGLRTRELDFEVVLLPPPRTMRGSGVRFALGWRCVGIADDVSSGAVAQANVAFDQTSSDDWPAHPQRLGQCEHALPGRVARDQIVHIEHTAGSHEVFNLETAGGWYIANGLIVHNCRCSLEPIYDDADQVTERLGDWIENPASEPAVQAWSEWMQEERPQGLPPAAEPRRQPGEIRFQDLGPGTRAAMLAEQTRYERVLADIDAEEARLKAAQEQYIEDTFNGLNPPPRGSEERMRAWERVDDFTAARQENGKRRQQVQQEAAAAAREWVYAETPADIKALMYGPRGGVMAQSKIPEHIRQGTQELAKIVGTGLVDGKQAGPFHTMRKDDKSFKEGRSYQWSHQDHAYDGMGIPGIPKGGYRTGVTMHPKDKSVSTVVHELGHWTEAEANLGTQIQAHMDTRYRPGEQAVPMNDAVLGTQWSGGYRKNEMTKKDDFFHPYMGKEYSDVNSHEFLSMSVEYMYHDPVKFAREDPESFDFTLQLLRKANGTIPQRILDAERAVRAIPTP